MEFIAEAELVYKPDAMDHSFASQPYPENVSQVPFTKREETQRNAASGADAKCRALSTTRRYLPCHYFDYIGGSSTGEYAFMTPSSECSLTHSAGSLQLCWADFA